MAHIGLRWVPLIREMQILLTAVITKNKNEMHKLNNFEDLTKVCCVLLACVCLWCACCMLHVARTSGRRHCGVPTLRTGEHA